MEDQVNNSDSLLSFSLEKEISNLYKKDDYMKHCLVRNNIEPIALDDEVHILKREEQKTFNLTDILKSLENKKENDTEKSDVIFPEYVEHRQVEEDIKEEVDRINNGVYLHEVNIIDNSYYDSFSDNLYDTYSNPINIKGDMYIKNIVHFEDQSPYNSLYDIYKVEWFLGLDINDNRIHEIVPISQGMCFQIPFESLGKYIFCKAYRRIYVNSCIQKKEKHTVIDPHTLNTKPVKFKADPEYVEKYAITNKGPVLISIDIAFKILTYLCTNHYSTQVIIEDPLENLYKLSNSSSSDDDCTITTDSNTINEQNNYQQFVATLSVHFNELKFSLVTAYANNERGESGRHTNNVQSNEMANQMINQKKENVQTKFFDLFNFVGNDPALTLSDSGTMYGHCTYELDEKRVNQKGKSGTIKGKIKYTNGLEQDKIKYTNGQEDEKINCKKGNTKESRTDEFVFNLHELEFRLSSKEDCIVISIASNLQKSFKFVKYKMLTIKPVDKNISVSDLWVILLAFKSARSYKKIFQKYSKRIYTNTNISFVQHMINNYLIKLNVKNVSGTLPFHKINTIFN
ncbi:hypothetical protein MKS88_003115 [Plasmodium brasilianum]|uniref:Uncharacterized protein n=2 Tax=Plasmodium (Plasmodium) TaxID=418103 RepID=A0A1A8W346_PLAMA|nr:conserved Plasmodium protein, unknown function [Plasmodium malariae]KAI4837701.1 hypothetical protein MKS88_003115 [Plasmodium brasilianum]SBS86076.1 conserved Plasmodium protein, unknown function [Plasmodium malariae]SCN44626.1 conserved Plasmodium protein, unknown function [Plasmodium malariae]